jgi:hypothetical protein
MHASDFDPSSQAGADRFDIYRPIHKALRNCMSDTLVRVGNADGADDAEIAGVLAQVRVLASFCTMHMAKENTLVHVAMEARRPGSSAHVATEHEHHEWALDKLMSLAGEVEAAQGAGRDVALLRLYRYLAVFVAENFMHMNVEETDHNAVLWATHSDAELHRIEQAIVASIPPEDKALAMRWMLPALSHGERVALLSGMRAHMPPPAFEGILGIARQHLREADFRKLSDALDAAEPLAA